MPRFNWLAALRVAGAVLSLWYVFQLSSVHAQQSPDVPADSSPSDPTAPPPTQDGQASWDRNKCVSATLSAQADLNACIQKAARKKIDLYAVNDAAFKLMNDYGIEHADFNQWYDRCHSTPQNEYSKELADACPALFQYFDAKKDAESLGWVDPWPSLLPADTGRELAECKASFEAAHSKTSLVCAGAGTTQIYCAAERMAADVCSAACKTLPGEADREVCSCSSRFASPNVCSRTPRLLVDLRASFLPPDCQAIKDQSEAICAQCPDDQCRKACADQEAAAIAICLGENPKTSSPGVSGQRQLRSVTAKIDRRRTRRTAPASAHLKTPRKAIQGHPKRSVQTSPASLDRFGLGPNFVTGTDVGPRTSARRGQGTAKEGAGSATPTTSTRRSRSPVAHPDNELMHIPTQQIK